MVYFTEVFNFFNCSVFFFLGGLQCKCKEDRFGGLWYHCQTWWALGWCRNCWDSPEDGGGFKGSHFRKEDSCGNGWRFVWTLSPVQEIPPRCGQWASRIRIIKKRSHRTFKRWVWDWSCSPGCYKFDVWALISMT